MKRFLKSFHYAIQGVLSCAKGERNFQVHVFAAFIVVLSGILTKLTLIEWMIIIILIGLMLTLEMLNTALERLVDLVTQDYHPLAKDAKDMAAGAVLVFAICSAVIGAIIFFPKWF